MKEKKIKGTEIIKDESFNPVLKESLAMLDEEEMPDAAFAWRRMIANEEEETQTKISRFFSSGFGKILTAAAAVLILTGGTLLVREQRKNSSVTYTTTSAYANTDAPAAAYGRMAVKDSAASPMFDYVMTREEAEYEENGESREEKIIRTVSFTMTAENYDEILEALKEMTTLNYGRIENLYSYGSQQSGRARTARLTLRIPKDHLDDFLSSANSVNAVITDYNESREDVSESYYDIESRLKVQQEKLQRLLEMLPDAKKVSEIIEIENAIADTQYYVDLYQGKINGFDSKIDYSTVSITLNEKIVRVTQEPTLWERIRDAIGDSVEEGIGFMGDLLVLLIALMPWLVLVFVIVIVIRIIRGKRKKFHKNSH